MVPDPYSSAIRWHTPPYPYLKLNTDGSALGNPGLAGVGGCCEVTWAGGSLASHFMWASQQIIWLNWLWLDRAWRWPRIWALSSYSLNWIQRWF